MTPTPTPTPTSIPTAEPTTEPVGEVKPGAVNPDTSIAAENGKLKEIFAVESNNI